MNITMRVAEAIVAFDFEDVPDDVRARAHQLICDSAACAVGAHGSDTMRVLDDVIEPGGGPCLILHSGRSGRLLDAVWLNSQAANMLDFDDSHPSLGHPGATIVPPALAIAQRFDKSLAEVTEAVVAGYEFGLRWAAAVFDYEGKLDGPWSPALLQAFGSYVTAAKLLDLDEAQVARGLYFAAAGMPLPVIQKAGINVGETMNGLKNYYGQTSQAMALAALVARRDVHAGTDVLDGEQGLWRMMSATEFKPDALLADLGTDWRTLEVQIKPYSSCRWSHAAIDAMLHLAPRIATGEVERIDVQTYELAATACSSTHPNTTFEMSFSIPHFLGMVLEGHSLTLLNEASLTDPAVLELSERVTLTVDPMMQQHFDEGRMPARVIVTLGDGRILEHEVLVMKGEPDNPIPDDEHAAKVRALVDSSPHDHVREYAYNLIQTSDSTSGH